ncbi:putative spore coat polysaccharide biosynthesis protein SpsF [Pillotina sp. SPG140]|jgi:spore coat polysaccharide biosynthesis protein SpsF
MIAVVVQARLDSKRLPQKSLLPLDKKPLLTRVMEALLHISSDAFIVVCPHDCVKQFEPLAQEKHFELLAGSKADVLNRYCDAIRHFHIDTVIRATADNPFVFADAAQMLLQEALDVGADYAAYHGLPYGAGVEIVRAESLLRAEREAAEPYHREHVCPYLYGHPELFLLHRPLAPKIWQGQNRRITVDTIEDYQKAQRLYTALPQDKSRYEGAVILNTTERFV